MPGPIDQRLTLCVWFDQLKDDPRLTKYSLEQNGIPQQDDVLRIDTHTVAAFLAAHDGRPVQMDRPVFAAVRTAIDLVLFFDGGAEGIH
ncbi:hypothetical protein CFY91_08850 [Pseudomonas fluvialis]|nr:hypothetical protein CFY91_08850 [Pseudomonas fluvialis]